MRRRAKASVLYAYAFGKAQRLLQGGRSSIGPIVVHGAVEPLNAVYRAAGAAAAHHRVTDPQLTKTDLRRALVIAPPSAAGTPWLKRFGEHSDAFASGWMLVRGAPPPGVNKGFVMSDHADWPTACKGHWRHGAERIIVTHGSTEVMVRWLCEQGLDAQVFATEYGGDDNEDDTDAAAEEPASATALRGRAMKQFAALFQALDATTAQSAKLAALVAYLRVAAPAMRPGPCTFWPVASRARWCPPSASKPWRNRLRVCPNGCLTKATRPWATWPKPSPRCCPARRAR